MLKQIISDPSLLERPLMMAIIAKHLLWAIYSSQQFEIDTINSLNFIVPLNLSHTYQCLMCSWLPP